VDQQQEQIDQLEDVNEHTKSQTKAGLEAIQYTMWNMCAARPDDSFEKKPSTRTSESPVMWNLCAQEGAPGMSKSFDKNHTHKFTRDGADPLRNFPDSHAATGSTPTPNSKPGKRNASWARMRMPPDFDTFQANVQESAQGAYVIGSALVEELVSQVQQRVGSGDGERGSIDPDNGSIPTNIEHHKELLQELMKKWNVRQFAQRLSCDPVDADLHTTRTFDTKYSMEGIDLDERKYADEDSMEERQRRLPKHSPRRHSDRGGDNDRDSPRRHSSSSSNKSSPHQRSNGKSRERHRSSSKQRTYSSSSHRSSSRTRRRHYREDADNYHS
jgi:hypothetical protein